MRGGLVHKYFLSILISTQVGIAYATDLNVDPTKPDDVSGLSGSNADESNAEAESGQTDWILTAIFFSEIRQVAVINGRSLTEGQMVNGQKVDKILEDKVLLTPFRPFK